jgi:hypothetical protein
MAIISSLVSSPNQKQILNRIGDWDCKIICTSVAKRNKVQIFAPIEWVAISFLNFKKQTR